MRGTLACLLVAAVALSLPALRAGQNLDEGAAPPVRPVTGFVVKWDDKARSFTLRMGKGPHEVQFVWTDQTKIQATPGIGDKVTVRYRKVSPTLLVAEMVTVRAQAPEGK